MNKILKRFFLLSFLIISSTHAYCGCLFDCVDHTYIAARAGLAWHQDISIKTDMESSDNNYNTGGIASASIGIGIKALRLEAEGLIIYNKLDNVDITIFNPPPVESRNFAADGYVRHYAIMFNAFYDFCLARCATLYLGAGVGFDFYRRNDLVNTISAQKDANLFAFQFMPGIAYHPTHCLDLTLGYRLYMTEKEKSDDGRFKTQKIPIVHNLELGFRYKL